jgi:hypothetical protein
MKHIKFTTLFFVLTIVMFGILASCNSAGDKSEKSATKNEIGSTEKTVYNVESPKTMLMAVSEACGGIDKLKALNDVEFDYHYLNPDGTKDVSIERYIFDDEVSWAKYDIHEVNVSPDLEGNIVQYFDGKNIQVYNNGSLLEDPKIVGTGQFLRQANYMWFNMMFKLTDPGIIYKYEGQENIEGTNYDIVNVTYDPQVTGKEQNDIFILYINPETHMVESFKFSLPAFGIEEPVLHAQLTYEEIEGIQVITRRIMTSPSPDGSTMVPLVDQQIKNIKFNNGFNAEQLSKDI